MDFRLMQGKGRFRLPVGSKRWLVLVGLACLLLAGFGCAGVVGESPPAGAATAQASGPQVTVFLQLKEAESPSPLWLRVAAVELLQGVEWQALNTAPLVIDTKHLGDGQLLVGRGRVPANSYRSLRFTFESGGVIEPGSRRELAFESQQVEVPFPDFLHLSDRESKTLIITLDAQGSLVEGRLLRPAMAVAPQVDPLVVDLAYVACPQIDTVYLFRTDKNRVIASIGVPGRPTYLDVDAANNRLYVLTEEEAAIKVFEISTSRHLDRIQIPLASQPNFMALSPDKRWAYVLDEAGDYAIRRDIKLGRKNPKMLEVLEGLEEGDRVITSSYDNFGDVEKLVLQH